MQFNGRFLTSRRLPNTCNVSFVDSRLGGKLDNSIFSFSFLYYYNCRFSNFGFATAHTCERWIGMSRRGKQVNSNHAMFFLSFKLASDHHLFCQLLEFQKPLHCERLD